MKRFIHTITEAAALLYCLAVLMAAYATGAIALCGSPTPAWYGMLITIILSAPVIVGVICAAKVIVKAIIWARKPKRLGVIPSHVIVRALCVTK